MNFLSVKQKKMYLSHATIYFVLVFGLLLHTESSVAQVSVPQVFGSVDVSTVRIESLTNEQILEIQQGIQSQGLTIDEAMDLARSQGLPDSEITKLRVRLATVTGSSSMGTDTTSTDIPVFNIQGMVEEIPSEADIINRPDVVANTDKTSIVSLEIELLTDIYGHSIFRDQSIDVFTTTDGARAPEWYVIGTGDQVRITIFGVSQADLLLEVSDEGYVQPTGIPRIFLKGLTIGEASRLLRERLSDFYAFDQEEFSLTMAVARTITVAMLGEVRRNGSFTVSALNSALNVLAVAGGPTEIGSVRSIQRIRGKERMEIDLYTFLRDPSVQTDYDLRHNDVLFLPVAEKVVTLEGAVKRPMRYELKSEEGFLNLLQFAGGISYDTAPNYIQITRIEQGEPRLYEYDLQQVISEEQNLMLKDGDRIRVRRITKPLRKFVEVNGAVFYPGTYDLEQNRQLRTLLEKAELRPGAMLEKAIIERRQEDESTKNIAVPLAPVLSSEEEFLLKAEDRVRIFSQSEYTYTLDVEISGDVRSPTQIPLELDDRLRLADALFLAGGLRPTAAPIGFVFRRELFNPKIMDHIRVDVTRDANFELQAGDQLVVYNQMDYTNLGELVVGGAVNQSVSVSFDPDLTLEDLLLMAGGVTQQASLNRVDVFRLDVSFLRGTSYDIISLEIDDSLNVVSAPPDFQLQPYDRVIVRNIPEYNINATVQLNGEVRYSGTYPLESQKTRLSELILEAGGLTSSADTRNAIIFRSFQEVGPIAVDLSRALSSTSNSDRDNPILFDGDVLLIPKAQNTVTIRLQGTSVGELQSIGVVDTGKELGGNREMNVIYRGGKSARWYIQEFAGGFAQEADKWSVTVTRPNGEVRGTRRSLLLFRNYPTVEPGSTITLRIKPEDPREEEELINWEEVQARSIQLTTTVLTLLILVDRLAGTP